MPKLKTKKAAAKRFFVKKTLIEFFPSGYRHNLINKSSTSKQGHRKKLHYKNSLNQFYKNYSMTK